MPTDDIPPQPATNHGCLAALITVLVIIAILFIVYRIYVDTHCTIILGTQVCNN